MNDILRMVGGGLLALICCYIGLLIKRRYKSREGFYDRAVAFCKVLSSEISLAKATIPDIVDGFATTNCEFDKLLKENIALLKNSDALRVKTSILRQDESREMTTFFSSLGKSAYKEQLSIINEYKKRFEDKLNICAKESKQLGSMYFKLSVLLGLALILIIA